MHTCSSPPALPNSMRKLVTTTTSLGVAIFANWVLISERTCSNLISCTGFQEFSRSSKTIASMRWMMRCSVGVKSRPSMRASMSPLPPNRLSTTRNTRVGSKMKSAVPRSGFACTRLRLVGTTRLRMNSLYLTTRTGPTEISALRRVKLKRPMRRSRAKRSLMISSVGMRPRTMRSCVARLYGRTPEAAGASWRGSSPSPDTPFRSASTSSCDRKSLLIARSLDDERGEEHAGYRQDDCRRRGRGFRGLFGRFRGLSLLAFLTFGRLGGFRSTLLLGDGRGALRGRCGGCCGFLDGLRRQNLVYGELD